MFGMLRRFRLERLGIYEKMLVVHRLVHMLEAFIDGRPADLEIGSEQGGIPHWDDYVVRRHDEVWEHVQIKRQNTDFCTQRPQRDGATHDLSALDDVFASLAQWSRTTIGNDGPAREFVVYLPTLNVLAKRELSIAHIEALCSVCRNEGTTADRLAARGDGPTKRAFEWLVSWCGFADWDHILTALRRVTIKSGGLEADLRDQISTVLARHFLDANAAYDALIAYIVEQSADVSAFTTPRVFRRIQHLARPELPRWTQYLYDIPQGTWRIAGTQDVVGAVVEDSPSIVNGLWAPNGHPRRLRVAASCPQQHDAPPSLPSALMRLALHLQGSSQAILAGEPTWQGRTREDLGRTLGTSESDLDHLNWVEEAQRLNPSTHRELSTIAQARTEAEALGRAMDREVWLLVVAKVQVRLAAIADVALLQSMETMWTSWRQALDQDDIERTRWLAAMLYPIGEGRNIEHRLRVGPRTIDLLVDGVQATLLVAVAIGGSDSLWNRFTGCGAVTSIALRRWSGPLSAQPRVYELTSHSLGALLGSSVTPIVVLPGVEAPPSMILEVGLADDAIAGTSLAVPPPAFLVTGLRMAKHLREASLQTVRAHYGGQWNALREARSDAIQIFHTEV